MLILLAVFASAFALSLLLTHRVRFWARLVGMLDEPDERRLHERPVPRVGGIAVYLGTMAVVGIALALGPAYLPVESPDPVRVGALVTAATAVFALGLVDDVRGLRARTKFAAEAAIAVGVFAAGIGVGGVGLPDGTHLAFPGWAALGLTVLWIVGITNAFNLIDGSDGVAGGAAIFACGAMAVVSLLDGSLFGAVGALALAGAVLGFLFFNFPPASIFLGDCGSLFLGFSLAALGLATTQKATTAVAVAIPVVSFGLPILDTLLAVVRRFLRREPLFSADRGHIHHRLRELGHSPRQVALLLYAASGALAGLALLLTRPPGSLSGLVLVLIGLVALVCIQRLRIPEFLELHRIVDRGLKQRSVIAHNVRVRKAVAALSRARHPASVLHGLERAFASGEFDRVELWLPAKLGAPLRGLRAMRRRGDGWFWTWNARDAADRDARWELRIPFRGEDGARIGRLSLWSSESAGHLLTDVRLIAVELQPALVHALERLGTAPVPERADPVSAALREGARGAAAAPHGPRPAHHHESPYEE